VEGFVNSLPSKQCFLDIPVGTGRFFPFYAKAGVEVIGIDISENMLSEAAEKLEVFEKKEKVSLLIDNITQLKLSDLSVDVSICWRLFHLLPEENLIKAAGELSRVTRKQILVQTFGVKEAHFLSHFKQVARPIINLLHNKNVAQENEPWCHIQSYEHNEKLILGSFKRHNFFLKQKTLLDTYKNTPVNIYLFERHS
jgi:ubiquinone/menaquinone biosynthesis C-methylase UbiE